MREIRPSGSMSGKWKRSKGRYSGTGTPKGPVTRMASLNHRATSRLYPRRTSKDRGLKVRIRRRLFLLVFTLFLSVTVIFLYTVQRRRVIIENLDLIQVGMSSTEVENFLGQPPGDYGPGKTLPLPRSGLLAADKEEVWHQDKVSIFVGYDENGHVAYKSHTIRIYREEKMNTFQRIWLWITSL